MTEILSPVLWYLAVSVIGWVTFPIVYKFFPKLTSRGFAFARPLGMLLWGFVFWLLATLGVLQNDIGGEIIAFAVVAGLAGWALWAERYKQLIAWLKQNYKSILTIEILFLLTFAFWTWIRGMNPEVAYTEKPMELAFINSILRSPSLPPQDPWLSGYSISYYYFGYILIAMLTRVTGIASAVSFNLSSSLWFALTATAAYGIVFDLLAVWAQREVKSEEAGSGNRLARLGGFLGPLYILIASTVEGVLEFLHAGGVFWKQDASGILTSKFWTWLAISDLDQAPTPPFTWIPSRASGWLWWRGSRVLTDLSLANNKIEIIDEFPFFSYLLSDLHPHVLAMPFALLAIGLCLNFFLGAREFFEKTPKIKVWMKHWEFWLTALILGSMAFFNTWDFPIYVGLFCFIWAYSQYRLKGWVFSLIWEAVKNGLILGVTGVALFLPFYLGFKSQAGGLLPSLEYMTRGVQFWILFGVLLVPILAWLIHSLRENINLANLATGLKFTLIVFAGLFTLSLLYGLTLLAFQPWGTALMNSSNGFIANLGSRLKMGGDAFIGLHGNFPPAQVIQQAILRRVQSPGMWLTLFAMLVITWMLLVKKDKNELAQISTEKSENEYKQLDAKPFILILILFGIALTAFPEFFYLRDQFGNRMNTIFKFYFEAWIFWGLAAAVGTTILFNQLRRWNAIIFQAIWILVLLAGLAYPAVMLWDKTNHISMKNWTLNGNAYIGLYTPEEYAAMTWLQGQPLGIVSEAVGGSYTDYARVSTRTGLPTVLGWPGHESQWRGGDEEMGSRMTDIQTLYETHNTSETLALIQKYRIRYVYVGNLERSSYQVFTGKFDSLLTTAYQNGSVTVYEVPTDLLTAPVE